MISPEGLARYSIRHNFERGKCDHPAYPSQALYRPSSFSNSIPAE